MAALDPTKEDWAFFQINIFPAVGQAIFRRIADAHNTSSATAAAAYLDANKLEALVAAKKAERFNVPGIEALNSGGITAAEIGENKHSYIIKFPAVAPAAPTTPPVTVRTYVIDKDAATSGTYTATGTNTGTLTLKATEAFTGTFYEQGVTGTGFGSTVLSNTPAGLVTASFNTNKLSVTGVKGGTATLTIQNGGKDTTFTLTVVVS